MKDFLRKLRFRQYGSVTIREGLKLIGPPIRYVPWKIQRMQESFGAFRSLDTLNMAPWAT
jgi:hypothetical protein